MINFSDLRAAQCHGQALLKICFSLRKLDTIPRRCLTGRNVSLITHFCRLEKPAFDSDLTYLIGFKITK